MRLLPTLALGVFLGALDMNILALALPAFSAAFDIQAAATVWIVTAYSAAYLVAMPIIGRLGDMFGRRKMFLAGLLIFTLGSLLCAGSGWAGNVLWLMLAGRVLQGLGAGGIVPVATAMIGEHVPAEKRGRALGVIGMVFAVASILGPITGGLLLDFVAWEWLFAINVPIGLGAVAMAMRHLPASPGGERGAVDWLGGALLTVALATFMVGAEVMTANLKIFYPWHHGLVKGLWAASAVSMLAFLWRERAAASPMLDLSLYRLGPVRLSFALGFLYGVGMMIAMVFTPMFFHYRFGFTSIQAGLALLPMAFAMGYSAMKGGRSTDKVGARTIMGLGLGLFALGLALLAATLSWAPIWAILGVLVVVGLGFGYCHAPLNHVVLKAVDAGRHGQATGAINTHRSLGGIVGATAGALFIADSMAGVGPIMIRELGGSLPPNCILPMVVDPNHVAEMVAMMPPEVQPRVLATAEQIVAQQMIAGLTPMYWLGAGALALAWALAWKLPKQPRQLEAVVPAATAADPLETSS